MIVRLRYDFVNGNRIVPDGYSYTCTNSTYDTPLSSLTDPNGLAIGDFNASYNLSPIKVIFSLPDMTNASNAVVSLSRKMYGNTTSYKVTYNLSKSSDAELIDSVSSLGISGFQSSWTDVNYNTTFAPTDSLVVDVTFSSTSSSRQFAVVYKSFYVEADYDLFDVSTVGYNDDTSLQFTFKNTDFFTLDKVEILGLSEVVTVTDFSKPVEVGSLLSDGRVTTGITYKIYYTNKAGVSHSTEIANSYIVKNYIPPSINAPSLLPTNSSLSSLVERFNDIDNLVNDISERLSDVLVFYGGSVGDASINTLVKNISMLLSELPVKD